MRITMNIGNRKKRKEDEFIPLWTKQCDLDNIECSNCSLYSERMQWCRMFRDSWLDELHKGKKLR